ncbi:hypothetical protein Hanom_Chr06g00540231 [Helianthus anomalus]
MIFTSGSSRLMISGHDRMIYTTLVYINIGWRLCYSWRVYSQNSNVLILSTSSNQVYAVDVEAKKFGEWLMHNTFLLPQGYHDFLGEVIGLTFPSSTNSSVVVIYSAMAMCFIDFGMPVDKDDRKVNGHDFLTLKK